MKKKLIQPRDDNPQQDTTQAGPYLKAGTQQESTQQDPREIDNRWPDDTLPELYKKWVQHYSNRELLFKERLDAAWSSLLADIQRWTEALGTDKRNRLARHQLTQFNYYVEFVYKSLGDAWEDSQKAIDVETQEFRALVIGVLTAQWTLLQGAAVQRVSCSPYRQAVSSQERELTGYYDRLYDVLINQGCLDRNKVDSKFRVKPISAYPPLLQFGRAGQLVVLNRRLALTLSVPIAAMPNPVEAGEGTDAAKHARMSIPHEVAHAIFVQVPEVTQEVRDQLLAKLEQKSRTTEHGGAELSRQEGILRKMAIDWTEEICADLWGTALAGEEFAKSARWTMAGTASSAGLTDATHPPPILRPIIHLQALEAIADDKERFTATREYFMKAIETSGSTIPVDSSLNRRFRSVPALVFVRMETVSGILDAMVRDLLALPLQTLGGRTMTELLVSIYTTKKGKRPTEALPDWVKEIKNSDDFLLDFPAELIPSSYATPGVSIFPYPTGIPIVDAIIAAATR